MKATTIRFTEDVWELLEREAARQGLSTAQLIRDAAVLRVAALAGRRGDLDLVQDVEDLAARSERRTRRAANRPVGDPMAALHDPERLRALIATRLLDSPPEERFDRLTRLGARALHAPVALVSLVDDERQFLKSAQGVPEPWASRRQTPLSHSFCQHAVARDEPLVVADAREDPRLRTSKAIVDLDAVAYLGVPLHSADGRALGTFCVIDSRPREWTQEEVETVRDLASSAEAEIARDGSGG
jgi:hypothetical protein